MNWIYAALRFFGCLFSIALTAIIFGAAGWFGLIILFAIGGAFLFAIDGV